jgi:uncharacterized protein
MPSASNAAGEPVMTDALVAALDAKGFAVVPKLLDGEQCAMLSALFSDDGAFRATIDMARFRFGQGRYRYFNYPLPALVARLRAEYYPKLRPIANRWADTLKTRSFPASHAEFIDECRRCGQSRPTPLLLRYQAGDYNCLHQDLYGACVFPLQMVCLLSDPGRDFDGGELVLTEQRPRAQTRAHVVPLGLGDAAVIASHHFPRQGTRGSYRATLRHGVAEIRRGERFTLGLVFHDAE